MPNTTNRLQLQLPLGGDTVAEIRTAVTNHANTLDTAVCVTSGTIAAIPAPSPTLAGRRYFATDVGIELWDSGTAWVPTSPGPPIGAMMQWTVAADPVDPDGVTRWLVADGRAISRSTYANCFNRLGVLWGAGNGTTTFNIPDTRGRVMAGPDTGTSTGAAGRLHAQTISGITNQNTLAGVGGADSETLAVGEMPSHTHTQNSHNHTDAGHTHSNPNAAFLQANQITGNNVFATITGVTTVNVATGFASIQSTTATNQNTGGGGAHNNAQPYLVVNHIIRVL